MPWCNATFTTVSFKALFRYQYLQLWKLVIFNCDFSVKVTCAFLLHENMQKLQNLTLLTLKNDDIFYIIDQIKVSRVPLWIRHCHLCMDLKLSYCVSLRKLFSPQSKRNKYLNWKNYFSSIIFIFPKKLQLNTQDKF